MADCERARVLSLLQGEGDIELIGECATGHETKAAIERGSPDLLFSTFRCRV